MRNRIACSAHKLSQLEPDMVQSVVGGHVFKLGSQYYGESRVRILESSESQILAEVDGTYGVYSQSIRLKNGTLITKCSCPASEQPFCRHCVAVLLAFYEAQRDVSPSGMVEDSMAEDSKEVTPYPSPEPPEEPKPVNTTFDFKFHELSLFIEWMQSAVSTLGHEASLPIMPSLEPGAVRGWVEAIQHVHDRLRRSEAQRIQSEAELLACQQQIVTLTQELDRMTREAKESKVKCAHLEQELQSCQSMLDKHAEVIKERDRYIDQLNGLRGELLRKGAELDSLAASLKQVSAALQAVTPPPR
ncbi:MAG: hypothetical protein D6704_13120 [Nitrospirae bacterium]|nr:MAG: hypothetical protein D6704_13120 [Nitrospirota bacterium]